MASGHRSRRRSVPTVSLHDSLPIGSCLDVYAQDAQPRREAAPSLPRIGSRGECLRDHPPAHASTHRQRAMFAPGPVTEAAGGTPDSIPSNPSEWHQGIDLGAGQFQLFPYTILYRSDRASMFTHKMPSHGAKPLLRCLALDHAVNVCEITHRLTLPPIGSARCSHPVR